MEFTKIQKFGLELALAVIVLTLGCQHQEFALDTQVWHLQNFPTLPLAQEAGVLWFVSAYSRLAVLTYVCKHSLTLQPIDFPDKICPNLVRARHVLKFVFEINELRGGCPKSLILKAF